MLRGGNARRAASKPDQQAEDERKRASKGRSKMADAGSRGKGGDGFHYSAIGCFLLADTCGAVAACWVWCIWPPS